MAPSGTTILQYDAARVLDRFQVKFFSNTTETTEGWSGEGAFVTPQQWVSAEQHFYISSRDLYLQAKAQSRFHTYPYECLHIANIQVKGCRIATTGSTDV